MKLRSMPCIMKILSLIWSLLLVVPSLSALPAQVILLRHAEKPADEASPHLSPRGEERARALATLLTTNPVLTANGPPVALFASRATKEGHGSRPALTLKPLAARLHLAIQAPYAAKNTAALAQAILQNPAYDHKTVVVCWVHDNLADLAEALGVKPRPGPWKKSVYDRAWRVVFERGEASLSDFPQTLLPGDAIY